MRPPGELRTVRAAVFAFNPLGHSVRDHLGPHFKL
jgi:hypothetical protein